MLHASQGWLQPSPGGGGWGVGREIQPSKSDCILVSSWSKWTFLTQDDLRSSVVTCRDDGRVVFVVKGGAAEVDKPHCGVIYSPLVAFLKEKTKAARAKFLNFTSLTEGLHHDRVSRSAEHHSAFSTVKGQLAAS